MKKFFVLGLVAVALSAGLMLTSCAKCPGLAGKNKGDCSYPTKECEDACIANQIIKNPTKGSWKCNC